MEEKNKLNIWKLGFSVVLIVSISGFITLLNNNNNLLTQIEKREKLIRKIQVSDSILSIQNKANESIVEKYISDCGIIINGKEVSTEELVTYLKNQLSEINDLNDRNFLLEDSIATLQLKILQETSNALISKKSLLRNTDSLTIYKAFYNLAKKNLNIDFNITETNDDKTISIILPKDSLQIYKKLFELTQRDYGIKYNIETKGNTIIYSKIFTKVDSALIVYKYYKDKLSIDTSHTLMIELPDKIKKRNKK